MKIRTKKKSYEQVMSLPKLEPKRPMRQWGLFRLVTLVYGLLELIPLRFRCKKIGMERLGKQEPCLFLMNHSSFLDLKIAFKLLFGRPYHVVSTQDSFIGKKWMMRPFGCIPTQKFVSDISLIRDMVYALHELKDSVLMYPEAGYSFDGTAVVLPDSLGKCLKILKVPVVMIRTYGAFSRDPLYNGLQLRKVPVYAEMEYILSAEDVATKSAAELNEILRQQFTFDQFKWQQDNQICIDEPFRADGLNRVLYKCAHCGAEGKMEGKGTKLICHACGKVYTLTEYGYLQADDGETRFDHVPDWNQWQRQCVREELVQDRYHMDLNVDIYMLVDTKCLYKVGKGRLEHTKEGLHLTGCNGQLDYWQKPHTTYCLNSDFFWYEIGDVIGFGNDKVQYYCFPQNAGDVVAKARLAAEELYKLLKENKKKKVEAKV